MIDATDLAVIREWAGTNVGTVGAARFDDVDITDRLGRLADPLIVALSVLRQIRADYLVDPASITLVGDYSHDVAANLAELNRRIGELERATGDPLGASQVTVAHLSRRSRRR